MYKHKSISLRIHFKKWKNIVKMLKKEKKRNEKKKIIQAFEPKIMWQREYAMNGKWGESTLRCVIQENGRSG